MPSFIERVGVMGALDAIANHGCDLGAGLGSVATAPDARRRGAASRLLAGALTLLEADGDHTFFLFADRVPELCNV